MVGPAGSGFKPDNRLESFGVKGMFHVIWKMHRAVKHEKEDANIFKRLDAANGVRGSTPNFGSMIDSLLLKWLPRIRPGSRGLGRVARNWAVAGTLVFSFSY